MLVRFVQTVHAAVTAQSIAEPFLLRLNNAILYPLIALLLGVALLVFLWGVFQYIAHQEGEQARADGRKHMLFGIIGLVVMVSALAILNIALRTFGIPPAQ